MAIYRSGAGILRVTGAGVAGAEACCDCGACNCDPITDLSYTFGEVVSGFIVGTLSWTINAECDAGALWYSLQFADGSYGDWTLSQELTTAELQAGTLYGTLHGYDCEVPVNIKYKIITCAGDSNIVTISSCPP